MTFFFDNSISYRIARGLSEFGEDTVALRDVMPADTPDTVWLPDVGARGWYVVHHDKKINSRPAEIQALMTANVGAFVFSHKKSLTRWQWVLLVLGRWENIKQAATDTPRPFVFSIPEKGRLRQIR